MTILSDVKNYLSIAPDDTTFDEELASVVCSVIFDLNQITTVKSEGLSTDSLKSSDWSDYGLGDYVKEYVRVKSKVSFDPPSSSFILDALSKRLSELEFRINEQDRTG